MPSFSVFSRFMRQANKSPHRRPSPERSLRYFMLTQPLHHGACGMEGREHRPAGPDLRTQQHGRSVVGYADENQMSQSEVRPPRMGRPRHGVAERAYHRRRRLCRVSSPAARLCHLWTGAAIIIRPCVPLSNDRMMAGSDVGWSTGANSHYGAAQGGCRRSRYQKLGSKP
jgi:hypothetical protein